ncbi:MAG TPA: T9SS type A sorting domain-containing protein, partial [Cyclobacteriaceae bacterium]|nr:T9SS type A sorting domain-containing protein [Cyclobacteriaceae bacterium]
YDDEPWIGKTYYRLKQTDYDGTYTYSNLVLVVFDESPGLQVFPNPATDKYFKILIKGLTPNQQVEVSLTDSRGVLVYGYSETSNEGGKVEITVDMTEKPAGMYLIRVVGSILPASKVIVN